MSLVTAAFIAIPAHGLSAQRFEGIITMRLGNLQGGRGGGRGQPLNDGRGAGAAAGTPRDARGGRGGDSTGAARGPGGRGGRGGALDTTDAGRGGRGGFRGGAGGPGGRGGGRGGPPADIGEAIAAMGRGGNFAMPSEIQYMTRRGKVRIALGGGSGAASPGAMIYAPDEGVVYTLIPAMSMYAETNFSVLAQAAAADTTLPATRRAAILRAPVITHTKKFDLIAEHRCEHILVTVAKQQTDLCMAKGLGAFVVPMGLAQGEAWQQVLAESNGFPLKVLRPDGSLLMEVTKVERKSLPASLFEVPDTYSKMPDRSGRPPQ